MYYVLVRGFIYSFHFKQVYFPILFVIKVVIIDAFNISIYSPNVIECFSLTFVSKFFLKVVIGKVYINIKVGIFNVISQFKHNHINSIHSNKQTKYIDFIVNQNILVKQAVILKSFKVSCF